MYYRIFPADVLNFKKSTLSIVVYLLITAKNSTHQWEPFYVSSPFTELVRIRNAFKLEPGPQGHDPY